MHELAQPAHVLVLDVAAILAQMHGDAVGAAQMRLDGGPHRIRLVRAARLAQRRDVIDVDAELDHRGLPRCIADTCNTLPFVIARPSRLRVPQVLHDAAAEYPSLFEVVIEHAAHQALGLGGHVGVGIAFGRERDQRRAANDRPAASRLGRTAPGSAIECVMVALIGVDRRPGVGIMRESAARSRVPRAGAARSDAASRPASTGCASDVSACSADAYAFNSGGCGSSRGSSLSRSSFR